MKFTILPLFQESAVSALSALCNEYYINENGEADPALQGKDFIYWRGQGCWAVPYVHFGGIEWIGGEGSIADFILVLLDYVE